MTSHAVMSLPPDERPAALQRNGAARPKRPPAAILLGKELEADRIGEALETASLAYADLVAAFASGDVLQVRAAALTMHREARVAFGLAAGLHRDLSEHLRRQPYVRG